MNKTSYIEVIEAALDYMFVFNEESDEPDLLKFVVCTDTKCIATCEDSTIVVSVLSDTQVRVTVDGYDVDQTISEIYVLDDGYWCYQSRGRFNQLSPNYSEEFLARVLMSVCEYEMSRYYGNNIFVAGVESDRTGSSINYKCVFGNEKFVCITNSEAKEIAVHININDEYEEDLDYEELFGYVFDEKRRD